MARRRLRFLGLERAAVLPEHGAREVEKSEAKPTLPEPTLESRAVYTERTTWEGMQEEKKLRGWRSFFWPIHRWELKKFLPMLGMFFFISFNYNALRAYKDALVVTAEGSGAETIPFIKLWAILPSALLLTYIFTRLTNRYSREKVFYLMMGLFLSFFLLFTFVLFPLQDVLHPHAFADRLQAMLPEGFSGLIAIFRNWTFTLFYVMSELWGTAILTVLFWGFANDVITVSEAKRYYGLFMIGANIAGILSGQVAVYFSGSLFLPAIPYGTTAWDQSILFLNLVVVFGGLCTMALFRWLHRHVVSVSPPLPEKKGEEKPKMSMRKNFAYLARSPYLLLIASIVLAYNVAINLIEVVWKNQIKELHPDPSSYNAYMGEVMTMMGVFATAAALLVTTSIIRRFSWTFSALIPPLVTLLTGAGFFLFALLGHSDTAWLAAFTGATPLMLSVTLGSIQNCLTRASKYTLFDATKEMAFIPLNSESKLKGKAAIDGVGSRLGKSGGSLIHTILLFQFSTIAAATPYIAILFFTFIGLWLFAVLALGKRFEALSERTAKEALAS